MLITNFSRILNVPKERGVEILKLIQLFELGKGEKFLRDTRTESYRTGRELKPAKIYFSASVWMDSKTKRIKMV
jgi:hypothetical protein